MRWVLAVLLLGSAACGPSSVRFHAERTPDRLSDWGLFELRDGRAVLSPGVVPYELNSTLFTDYAHKLRTVWMPEGSQATVGEDGAVEFPVGTVISKTFYYPRDGQQPAGSGVVRARKIEQPALDWSLDEGKTSTVELGEVRVLETRLLVHRERGWVTLPYIWNEAQTEATLEIIGGLQRVDLAGADGDSQSFHYVVPDANQCSGCHVTDHTEGRPLPIGPKLRHLNRSIRLNGRPSPQLTLWTEGGLLAPIGASEAPRAARAFDTASASLDARARAYLDINCGHCHNEKGPADTSGLFLDATVTEMRRLGACKPPIAAGRGSGDRLVSIHPGRADDSIMPFRMDSVDPGIAMPELGRSTVHREGVALIREWIDSLDGDCEPALEGGFAG